MTTVAVSIFIGVAAIWGVWDWRIAVTAWSAALVADFIIFVVGTDS